MCFTKHTTEKIETILSGHNVDAARGLSETEAAARLVKFGANLIKTKEVGIAQLFFRQFKSAFIYLLFGAAGLAFFMGELIDGSMIVLFVLINAVLGFYQEYRSEQTLKLLKQFVVSRARVLRNGEEKVIENSQLVPGDIVIVETGDVIPADVRFIEENNLTVNETILTGESVPIKKTDQALKAAAGQIFQALNIGFSGTTVVGGKGKAIVLATGNRTEIGNISHLATDTVRVSTFAKGIDRFSRFILRLVLATLIFIFLANILIRGGQTDFGELLIFSIALAVSVIPEALPVVITFSLSRGALRLAKNKVVVKRLTAIEDLGGIEVLCTDKTGTLTENVLAVSQIYQASKLPVVYQAGLAAPFLTEKQKLPNNAFDLAIWNKLGEAERETLKTCVQLRETPFDPVRRRNSVLIQERDSCRLIVRGAAEEIVKLCPGLSIEEQKKIKDWVAQAGSDGCRVIAVAEKSTATSCNLLEEETGLNFVGLISFVDPIKASTKEAIAKAKDLGIGIKILTGDSPEVAGWVGRQIGLVKSLEEVITGDQLEALSAIDQHEAVEKFALFARVSPQQKYQIIKLLETKREVGFLGEGINDAPALKIANVGLVVDGASDIAREAADIILLNPSLKVIIDGIEQGREVFSNTLKYIKATLSSNFGNFYAVAIASLIIDFLPMLPLQILMLNLLSDFPMIAIATDNIDPEELKKPKSYNVKEIALLATVLGIVSTVFDFIYFGLFYRISPEVLHTNWFIGSILTELAFLFSIRCQGSFFKAKRPSATVLWLSGLAAATTIILPFTEIGKSLFKFTPPTFDHLLLILAVAATYFLTTEIVKVLYYKFINRSNGQETA